MTNEPHDPEKILSIARTCRQVYHEATRIHYGDNKFEFSETYSLYVFLYMIGWDRRQLIKSISFAYRGPRQREAFELLGDCTWLRRLHITVSHETTRGCRPQRTLLEAKGLGVLRGLRGFHLGSEDRSTRPKRVRRLSRRHFTDDQITGLEEILNSELVDRN